MKKNKWLLQGLFLGFVFFLAIWLVHPIGVSTQFSVVSGIVHSAVDPSVITEDPDRDSGYQSTNAYYDKDNGKLAENIKHPFRYDMVFVLAIPLGAFIGSVIAGKRRNIHLVKNNHIVLKKGFIKRYFPSFISGFLLLFGARMAGGCTSGHMMSGMMQGSVSGYLFAAAVFAVAIPVAILSEGRHRKEKID